jgi:hypothetical protein
MTINKAQGQTFDRALVYLPTPVFSHGQLYVALSRVGNPKTLRVAGNFDLDGHPRPQVEGCANSLPNIVWYEVL